MIVQTLMLDAEAEIDRLAAENAKLTDWKRKQAEDIMTLGMEIGKLRTALEEAQKALRHFAGQKALDIISAALNEETKW